MYIFNYFFKNGDIGNIKKRSNNKYISNQIIIFIEATLTTRIKNFKK